MAAMQRVRVLVVDDNPQMRDLVAKGLEPHAEIDIASDGVDALLKAVDQTPDMIVCDYKMPGMDGRQFYEKLRGRQATRATPFIFLATRSEIEEKLRPLVDGVEDYIQKPFYVKELVRRTKKVIDRLALEMLQKRASRPGVLEGRLEEMNIIDLLQTLEMGQKSGRLTVRQDGAQCEMYFTGGVCKHATNGTQEGEEAVCRVIQWDKGEFEIDFNATSDKVTIERTTQGLLMEALRLVDEAARDAAPAES
jgi:CheY-like chemotaxis protein